MEDGVGIQRNNPERTSTFHGKIGEIYSDRGSFAGEHEDRLEIDIIPRSSDGKTQIKITQSYRGTAFSIEQIQALLEGFAGFQCDRLSLVWQSRCVCNSSESETE